MFRSRHNYNFREWLLILMNECACRGCKLFLCYFARACVFYEIIVQIEERTVDVWHEDIKGRYYSSPDEAAAMCLRLRWFDYVASGIKRVEGIEI